MTTKRMIQLGFSEKQKEHFIRIAQGTFIRNDVAIDQFIDISIRRGMDFIMSRSVNDGQKIIDEDSALSWAETHYHKLNNQ